MSTKQILILQGGGAFGAYECGVYQALAPHLDELAVVAGTSIGAIYQRCSMLCSPALQTRTGQSIRSISLISSSLKRWYHKILWRLRCG
jgi:predicted patatin/cPLA2 family phospholipase